MAEYIDKAALVSEVEKNKLMAREPAARRILEIIKGMTVFVGVGLNDDVAPVVRCKDCKFRKSTFNGAYYFCTVWDADESETAYVTDDDFCSYGERKEGAD